MAAYRQAPDIEEIEREAAIHSLRKSVTDCFLLGLREPLQTTGTVEESECLSGRNDIAGGGGSRTSCDIAQRCLGITTCLLRSPFVDIYVTTHKAIATLHSANDNNSYRHAQREETRYTTYSANREKINARRRSQLIGTAPATVDSPEQNRCAVTTTLAVGLVVRTPTRVLRYERID
ncbi:unnamed protein product [Trichogramma brassicae]|uniref:Uncharacterized protein n=1 Tax=Trichogramma brassicae TaxID=86971 RepID=A0A6H5I4E8_9HYME|nr:unnamed protein product [Trichogramma brassicae]